MVRAKGIRRRSPATHASAEMEGEMEKKEQAADGKPVAEEVLKEYEEEAERESKDAKNDEDWIMESQKAKKETQSLGFESKKKKLDTLLVRAEAYPTFSPSVHGDTEGRCAGARVLQAASKHDWRR